MSHGASIAISNPESLQQEGQRKRFLVVEDDDDIAKLIQLHLKDLGADIQLCGHGEEALELAKSENWDAIILDLQLPGIDGLDVCRILRAEQHFVPIMMVTSRSTELDRVLGLEIGADDYLVKPFSIPELKARVKALLRRANVVSIAQPSSSLSYKNLRIESETRQVSVEGRSLELTAKEFDLLWFFASQPGKVFKRSDLLDKVWGYGHEGYEHTVNSHINRLRSKLESNPTEPEYIQTVWGVGYRFAS